jgi:hypothetical protein
MRFYWNEATIVRGVGGGGSKMDRDYCIDLFRIVFND